MASRLVLKTASLLLLVLAAGVGFYAASSASVGDVGVVVDDPGKYSQVFAISDVHGMFAHVTQLLRAAKVIDQGKHWVAGPALLVITGDSIDKGSESIEVLKLWVSLSEEARAVQGRVVHVLGNHEAEFLAQPGGTSKQSALLESLENNRLEVKTLTDDLHPLGHFLLHEPVAARFGAWIFSHSGYFPKMSWHSFVMEANRVIRARDYSSPFLADSSSVLEAKKWELDEATLSDERLRLAHEGIFGAVFGHQPKAFGIEGRSAAKDGGHFIKIDNGMAPTAGAHPGSLLCFKHPSEMNLNQYPTVVVIDESGQEKALIPE